MLLKFLEIVVQPRPALTFRTIGGILDFRIFIGEKPSDVINQYTSVIGRPMIPPYWSLGFHLCRFNYGSVNHTAQILENNLKQGIPIVIFYFLLGKSTKFFIVQTTKLTI